MRGRALLLGSATGSLVGVGNDIEAMTGWLGELGFHLDVRQGPDATRDGMLDGLARLVRDARSGEAAVVYYSGHGGFSAVRPEARFVGGRFAPRAFQYLVPTDHDKHQSFRGIFRAELSSIVRDLSERTANITVILDCCHATDMVRNAQPMIKALVEPWSEGIGAHVAWLEAQGYDLERLPELRNDSMVLVSACAVTGRAYEYRRPVDGAPHGQLTDCLIGVAKRAPELSRVTWDVMMRRVAERMERLKGKQRPQVSGPAWRCLFSERRDRRLGALTLLRDSQSWRLGAGAAAGVVLGDRYSILDPLTDSTQPLAEVVVAEVAPHACKVSIVSGSIDVLEPGTIAVPRPGGPAHQSCCIQGGGALADALRRRVAEVPGLAVVQGGERSGHTLVIDVRAAMVDVLDGDGRKLRWPWCDTPEIEPSLRSERLDDLVEELRGLARASDLLALARARSLERSASPAYVFEWGCVKNGVPQPLPAQGAELCIGDRVYVSVENTGAWPIYVSALDVGVGHSVLLLNRNEPEGIDLGSGDTKLFGAPELGPLRGIELAWPADVPPDGPREESLIVFVSSGPMPVDSWQTRYTLDDIEAPSRRRSGEPIYSVHHVTFLLHPKRRCDAIGQEPQIQNS